MKMKKTKKRPIALENLGYKGLCLDCKHWGSCHFWAWCSKIEIMTYARDTCNTGEKKEIK